MSDGETYYWDACNFISYINGQLDRVPILDDMLSRSRQGQFRIITSVVSISETAFALEEQTSKLLDPEVERKIDRLWTDRKAITLVEDHEMVQREARRLMRLALPDGWRLKPMDAIHLATAKLSNATRIQTYDTDLLKFEKHLGIPIEQPTMSQGVLALARPADEIPTSEVEVPAVEAVVETGDLAAAASTTDSVTPVPTMTEVAAAPDPPQPVKKEDDDG